MSLFKKLYGGSFAVKSTESFAAKAPEVKSAMVVEGTYGLQVCCLMVDGKTTGYLPLSKNSQLSAGDEFPIATAKVLTLSKDGEDDIIRVVE